MQEASPRSFDAQMLDYLYGNDAPKALERKRLTDCKGNLWQLITEIEGGRRVFKRGNWRNEDQFEGEPMILQRARNRKYSRYRLPKGFRLSVGRRSKMRWDRPRGKGICRDMNVSLCGR